MLVHRKLAFITARSSLGSASVSLLTNFAVETSVIFLPLFAADLGANKLQIGVIGGAYGITYFLSSWIFGRQSDIKGRLLFVRIGLALSCPALAAQALVYNPAMLVAIRAVVGFCLGISAAAIMTYNFESGGSTGRFVSLGSLGFFLGAVAAFFIHSYHMLFILSAISCGIAFSVSLLLKEKGNQPHLIPATLTVFRRNTWVYLPFLLRQLGATMVWIILPLYLSALGASKAWIAILLGINTGGQFIAMMFVERLRESRLFPLGLLLSVLVFIGYSQASVYLHIIPVQLLLALAWSCLYVGALLLLLKSNEERATSTGLLFSTISISGAIGPFLGGLVAEYLGYEPLMYLASLLCLLGLGIALGRKKRT